MDEYIKQSIDSRKNAFSTSYEISADAQKEIDKLFTKIEKLGKSCKDVGEFEDKFQKSPMNQAYLDLFTKISTTSAPKASAGKVPKAKVGEILAEGVAEGALDRTTQEAKLAVLPTRASIHQKVHDEVQGVPVLGNAMDIGQKASYAAHLGKLFKKKKK